MIYTTIALTWFLTMLYYTGRYKKLMQNSELQAMPCSHCGRQMIVHESNLRSSNLCNTCRQPWNYLYIGSMQCLVQQHLLSFCLLQNIFFQGINNHFWLSAILDTWAYQITWKRRLICFGISLQINNGIHRTLMILTLNSKSKTHILLTRVISYTRDYGPFLTSPAKFEIMDL